MNLARRSTRRNPATALGVIVVAIAAAFAPGLALTQAGSAAPDGPLQWVVGTWTAKNPGDSAPFFTLKLEEKDGKLGGTISHGKFRVVGSKLVGVPGTAPEISISDLTVAPGALSFGWSEDSAFSGTRVVLIVEGTQVARLIPILSADQLKKIMAENPEANGLHSMIPLRRETNGTRLEPGGAVGAAKELPDSFPDWRVTILARIINQAEVLYRSAHGRYADYPTLVRSGQIREAEGHFTVAPGNLQSETEPLPGYKLRLLIAPDSAAYQLSIQKKVPAGCGQAVISDERGLLFEGHNPGCPPN